MGISGSVIVDASVEDVFAWYSRPGAFNRLAAPWAPVEVRTEAASLRDGTAVLDLPGGLRWVARHDQKAFLPGRRFVDEGVATGLRSAVSGVLPWRHIHEFEPVGDSSTRVRDTIETPIPERLLADLIAYRHRQLTWDLAAHRRAADHGINALTVAVTGATGLVGTALTAFLSTGGHRVIRLVRGEPKSPTERNWEPDNPDPAALEGVDAVIHLAGATIAGRFTQRHKELIASSRIEPTRLLSRAAASAGVGTFVSASAVGYYGKNRDDETLTETSPPPPTADFLSNVVARWEQAALAGEGAETRVVTVRTGIVQSPRGGTLKLLLPLFRAGLGGRLGSGTQWLPWIGIDDLVDIYHRCLWDLSLSGPVNAVAPGVVRNIDYTRALAQAVHRPAVVPVPAFGPALLLGREGADELAMASQRVSPATLLDRQHVFRTHNIGPALGHLLGSPIGS
ncbi:putative nucleoside-diphosphate sugar epimerase [Mycolicibacterium phlei]|uniref:TIGR01777 family oxidoreductase n=1 Tax=Mycobacteroides chelonae TaxID=1774 RepID=UPI000618B1E3|nr:TIGR01777 family oxidoreductase [Mycobacteroides chelonae]VEG18741.1 putative nucleoside-diphosphate sugar epimerase [Mycolicibacterium phlei]AKC39823.1 nucleoside-diphosphate sugar epimerase [Mycobacteroides chelonae]ANA99379.1 nucleoside-diphosphate sugar epimerase [Mycobacteroides chelonae CCUG 47445]OLT70803.1 TIGR01777 family protein [Mycobacteroides chelonae]ORV11204.1 nucleoside-diphosphate sugar epimerase [Mycobacteroides chelonae]